MTSGKNRLEIHLINIILLRRQNKSRRGFLSARTPVMGAPRVETVSRVSKIYVKHNLWPLFSN